MRRILLNYIRKNLGENHTATFDALKQLIQAMKKLGQIDEADKVYVAAKEKQHFSCKGEI